MFHVKRRTNADCGSNQARQCLENLHNLVNFSHPRSGLSH